MTNILHVQKHLSERKSLYFHSSMNFALRVQSALFRVMSRVLFGAKPLPETLMTQFTDASPTPHDDVIKWKHFPRNWPFVSGKTPVPGEFPAKWPVTRNFDVFFDLRPNKRLSKQSWGWWFETPSRLLWRHPNVKILNSVRIHTSLSYRWLPGTFLYEYSLYEYDSTNIVWSYDRLIFNMGIPIPEKMVLIVIEVERWCR